MAMPGVGKKSDVFKNTSSPRRGTRLRPLAPFRRMEERVPRAGVAERLLGIAKLALVGSLAEKTNF